MNFWKISQRVNKKTGSALFLQLWDELGEVFKNFLLKIFIAELNGTFA